MREELLLGDCTKRLAGIEDGAVDLILIDPPYMTAGNATPSRTSSMTRTRRRSTGATSAETQAVSSAPVAQSTGFQHTVRRTTAFTGRVMRHATGGFVAFLEEVPTLLAYGATPDEAEWNLRPPFAEYVAKERSEGRLCGEIRVLWME
jgi:predicted RNase H-like HicB family nuclease